jgi:glyoxylate utilization-related uncharacterized protein
MALTEDQSSTLSVESSPTTALDSAACAAPSPVPRIILVLEGELEIELRDRTVQLRKGDLFVVPRGVEHHPRARDEAHILLIEPLGTPNTGDAVDSEITAVERTI